MDRSLPARIVRVLADAASLGVAAATVLNALDWGARRGLGSAAIVDPLRLALLGSFPQVLFRGVRGVGTFEALALALAAALLIWRRTRVIALSAVAAALGVWAAAMACAAAYALDPLVGLAAPCAALVAAWALARSRTWTLLAMLIVAVGTGIGFFAAQNAALMAAPG